MYVDQPWITSCDLFIKEKWTRKNKAEFSIYVTNSVKKDRTREKKLTVSLGYNKRKKMDYYVLKKGKNENIELCMRMLRASFSQNVFFFSFF